MSKNPPRIRVPKYRLHRARGVAVVTFDGRDYYLGKYGTPESKAEYDRLVAQWIANGRRMPGDSPFGMKYAPAAVGEFSPLGTAMNTGYPPITVAEFVLAYLKYAKVRFGKHGHFYAIACAFKPMVRKFRQTQVAEFGPKRFKEVREALIQQKLKRREINRRQRVNQSLR